MEIPLPENAALIPGTVGYAADRDGTIYSRRPTNGRGSLLGYWKPLKPTVVPGGRLVVTVMGRRWYIHRLVLSAFAGLCPDGKECCHNDGNPTNNHIDNLRWGTRSENALDRSKHGTQGMGETHFKAVLSTSSVIKIRELHKTGSYTYPNLAAMFGVGKTNIAKIVNNQIWRHVIQSGN